ncbi:MAG: cellulase family glycosylhydrolase [Eubacterium sp.]|nr:cellulase family glycosylhydrolase [Eubacterium sp.]
MREFAGYEHGVNLGGWLSQCEHSREHYETFITEKNIEEIGSWGLDHVRIPIDYDLVETKDGEYIEYGFDKIQKAYDWCRKNNLNMILDLHKAFGYSFDGDENEFGFFENESYQERFYKLWEEFARRFGSNYEHMTFELLNEVTDKEFNDAWNDISTKCIKRIRKIAPEIKIIIGGYHNNSIQALPDLAMPVDENVVYTFHCYEPLIFTHQGAHWAPGMDVDFRMTLEKTYKEMGELSKEHLSQITAGFDGLDESECLSSAFFDMYFKEAVRVAEERNVALYCGEYGVIDRANPEDTLKWYKSISESFDRFHIGRASWNYKEKDFGLIDEHMKEVKDQVIKLL